MKKIDGVIDSESVINKEVIELAKYISENYVCSLGEALSAIVPVSMKAPKRQSVKAAKAGFNFASAKNENDSHTGADNTRVLTSYQQTAVYKINQTIEKNEHKTFLIHGVTASGKTEIYLNCIEKTISLGKNAIFLIPEISLTAQFVEIVVRRFGSENVGIWHSGISDIEKYKLFFKIKRGEIKVILGARSAVFAPFENLGIIIIDEEHEHTYKQEQKPSYDAREIARQRALYHKASVILGSATPSLESFKNALENAELIEIPERIDGKPLPEFKILSLKNKFAGRSLFLPETIEAISKTLSKKEQTIVFLNRRGYSPSIMCRQCASVYQCPNCSISMVYHKNPDSVKCHYCGHSKKLPMTCSVCGSKEVAVFGTGTQKAENELKGMFPKSKIFRLDGDTASFAENYVKAYEGIKSGEYDILLGTQMIAKGFDFPKVTLVCVIDADTSLYLPDFKSAERTFQLITQVSGRCGRGEIRGNVIIQTSHPEHYAITHAKKYDYMSFYKEESEQRKKLMYPPYCDIAKITVKNKNENKALQDSEKLFLYLDEIIKSYDLPLKMLGPATAYIVKMHNTYRKHIIIKGGRRNIVKLSGFISAYKQFYDTQISIEIMPPDLI